MNVIPDLIPRCTPTIDLAVSFGESPSATGGEPGAYLLPSQVCLDPLTKQHILILCAQTTQAPSIKLQVFENEEQESLYTLVMVDPGEWDGGRVKCENSSSGYQIAPTP